MNSSSEMYNIDIIETMLYGKSYLGSAQKDLLSSSGTTSVRFRWRAIVTISHICSISPHMNFRRTDKWTVVLAHTMKPNDKPA
jgi:hypothetical protein